MPPQDPDSSPSPTLDQGRVRVCGDLAVSLNRSWQVEVEPGQRPAAEVKGMAPIAPRPADGTSGESGDVYLAAVAAHDAFWLGFDASEGASFAVTIDLDGRNVLTGSEGPTEALELEPKNFLLVPDQPWFDTLARSEGNFEQLIPRYDGEAGPGLGAEVRLVIYSVKGESVEAAPEPEGPVPQYEPGGEQPSGQGVHAWESRALQDEFESPPPCGRIVFQLVEPERFEELTGKELPPDMFDDAGQAAPEPFNPFA